MQTGTASRLRPGSIERSNRSEGTPFIRVWPNGLRRLASPVIYDGTGSATGIPSGESYYSLKKRKACHLMTSLPTISTSCRLSGAANGD
jgi:hypothetical protein